MSTLKIKILRSFICYALILSINIIFIPETIFIIAQQQDAELLLEQGKQDYRIGRFEEAIEKLNRVIRLLENKDKIIDAYLFLAISHFALNQFEEAKNTLSHLTILEPEYAIDPLYFPPDFIKLHEKAKEESLANLSIITEPEEAEVYLDGKLIGNSPLEITSLLPGEHVLTLTKEGYLVKEERIALVAGVKRTLTIALEKESEKKPPQVAVTPPEKKPEVKKGKAWLWILIGGAVAAAVAIFATKGRTETGSGGSTSTPTYGSIQVKSYPNGAAIYLDGQNTGFRTNHTLTNVSTGSHTILLRLAGWKDWQDEVTVIGNQTAVVKPCLLPPNGCFRDNFQDGDASGWDLDPGWQVRSQGGNYFLEGRAQPGVDHFCRPNTGEWRNYTIELRFKIVTFGNDGGLWVHIRDNPEANYHIALLRNYIHMGKHINSINQGYGVDGAPANISQNIWHNLEFTAQGNNLQVFIDGQLMISARDNDQRLRTGQPILKVDDGAHAQVDDIIITSGECP